MEPNSLASFQRDISSPTGRTTNTETVTLSEEGDVLTTTKTVHVFTTSGVNTTQKIVQVDGDVENFIRDATIRRSKLSREAYLKLHRSSLKSNRHSVDVLKGKYENLVDKNANKDNGEIETGDKVESLHSKPTPTTKLSEDAVEDLKNKYSPRGYGYPNADVSVPARKAPPPPPPPRTSTLSYKKPVDEVVDYGTPKENIIIRQSSSEDSLEQLEGFLSEFTMDPKKEQKEKKRTSSFRRILSSSLFGKDKKKGEKKSADKTKAKKTENAVFSDNVQNEQTIKTVQKQEFYAETKPDAKDHHYADIEIEDMSEIEKRYAQMHINQFNQIKANFANPESFKRSPINDYPHDEKKSNYMNVADKYIDTSSSNNTLDSTYEKSKDATRELTKSPERFGETPPRAQETYQNLQLVKPKALIPINSERPLPNPYHNDEPKQTIERNLNLDGKEYPSKQPIYDRNDDFSDGVYGTVYDRKVVPNKYSPNLTKSSNSSSTNSPNSPTFTSRSSPRSPTLENSKLRLPPNREKVELQPRIKSPIPQPKISTDKIIATELLKPKSETKRHLSQQRLVFDYPENNLSGTKEMNYASVKSEQERKPYQIYSSSDAFQAAKWQNAQRELAKSPSMLTDDSSQFTTDATVHVDSPIMRNHKQYASLPPSSRSRSATREPVQMRQRSVTPVRRVPSTSSLQQSPQKHEIRQSVEIYCWKELQKLKDKQDQELRCQMQYTPYGYVEDPIIVRRSRSVEPNQQRNSRRSTSLPRELKASQVERNARMYHQPIPENRPIIYGENDIYAQKNPNFVRGSPQRRTVGLMADQKAIGPESYYGADMAYRPIFNRGSLTPQAHMEMQSQMYKKVSFSNSQNVQQSWPSKNGYVQSPPQRRLDKGGTVADDEVFMAVTQADSRKKQNDIDVQIRQMNQQIQREMLKNKEANGNEQKIKDNQYRRQGDEYVTKRNVNEIRQNGNTQKQNEANHYAGKNSRLEPLYVRQIVNENPYGSRAILENPYSPKQVINDNRQVVRMNENVYGTRQQFENPYGTRPVQNVSYDNQKKEFAGRPMQIREPIYGSKQQILNENIYVMKPNEMVKESPYGSRRPVEPNLYASKQSIAESVYGTNQKHITLSNKVCDMYGKIHDSGKPTPVSQTNYGQIHQTGVIYGQLQANSQPTGRPPQHQSYNQLSNNFVRGNRLTASANDMYKRYQIDPRHHGDVVYEEGVYVQRQVFNPDAPLPPTPSEGKTRYLMRRASGRAYPTISDTESDTSEVRRIMKRNYIVEEEWNSDGKSGRGIPGSESGSARGENDLEIRGRSRNARRDDPRRHTLAGDQQYGSMAGQGGPLSRTMDLEGQPRGYPPPTNPMLFDDDPGIMSEVETSSTGFRRGGKQRSSLPVVRTPSKTLERPLGLVFLQYRNETKRALLPNEITSIDTVKALFVRSFPKQLTMEYLDSPQVKIYIHDSSKDMFYELEDLRSHLREIRDRSVLRLFESADVSGGLPMAGIGIAGGVGHFEDPSYFSEPEFDSEYQHQHIHKSKGSAAKSAPYYMGSTASLPRSGLLRAYSPAVTAIPPERLKAIPTGAPPKPQRAYATGPRPIDGPPRPPDRFAPFQRPANSLFTIADGYMSSPERGSRYEDPYYSQYTTRSGSITPVIDEEISDTELLDDSYSLYGVKVPSGGPRAAPRAAFAPPSAVPYDTTRIRVENMERQLANLTGLVQKALTQTPATLQVPGGRDNYRTGDEFDMNSTSSSASLPDKSVSFEKSVSFSDEPPDMNSPKQHSPQHTADTKPTKPAIKSSTLPRTSSQERDRLKPAPPPKPASLSPGQYDGRHIYRDLQLTPEMYNQLRGLQKKAKDLRAEVRNLRRMSQAQAHSVRETIRDTFIKIRAMLLAGGEQVWQAGMDQERVRLSREEDLYKQEMLRLEKDLSDLESTVEELRGNVINRKTRVNMSDVENMALVLSKSSKTVADLKLRFPSLQDSMKSFLSSEMEKVVREEKFLKEEPERLESALRRCKKLTGTLVTLKRLASVQEQRLPCSSAPNDGRLSPNLSETPPVTPTSAQHSKPTPSPRLGQIIVGGDCVNATDGNQRPENALDALLDELQTFAKPHPSTVSTQMPQVSYPESEPPTLPAKGIPPSHSSHFGHMPTMSEIGRKGSMDSATLLPTQNLTVSTATGSLRRLHSYPSGSDTDNSPPIQPLQRALIDGKSSGKPPLPERNAELLQHISGKRIPPPPPPRTSSKSPLASPTSPSLPPRSPAAALQHIQNVQNMVEKPQSQFETATQNLGLATLRRNITNRGSVKDRAQTLPRNIGSNLQVHSEGENAISASNSSSCESVNSQDGTKKRKEELEQRHQELLKKQKALQEQYARLQQLQRGNNTLTVIPPAPDQLLKKTGSESNLLQKMGLQMSAPQMTGSLTNLPHTGGNTSNKMNVSNVSQSNADDSTASSTTTTSSTTTSKVYETDIL